MKKSRNMIAIIISIIVILIFVSAIVAYLYLKTDILKNNQQLFAKYITQTVEQTGKTLDIQAIEKYKQLRNENKYESKTSINIVSSEGGEISNPLNKLTATLDIQKDKEEQYLYGNGKILFDGEEYLQAEIIKEQDVYGIRFSDVVKQFVTIKNDENLEAVANSLGQNVSDLEEIMNLIDGNVEIISEESAQDNSAKYSNIIMKDLQKGTFAKQKNAMITYNNMTVKTNAYEVALDSEQVKNMLIEVLNNLKSDTQLLSKLPMVSEDDIIKTIEKGINNLKDNEEIPALKITVFEQKQTTLRTIIEIGQYKITIDNVNENGVVKNNIQLIDLDSDEGTEYNIEVSKSNVESQENFEIVLNAVENEKSNSISFIAQTKMADTLNELDIKISYEKDITLMSLEIENTTNIGNEIEKVQIVNTNENMLLNDLDGTKRDYVINFLDQKVPETVTERVILLMVKLGLKEEKEQVEPGDAGQENVDDGLSQVEINRFNAKFEFYTGDEVSAENVKKLLDVVKNNINGHAITSTGVEEYEKANITLYIEKDKSNEESFLKVLEKIKDEKKYKVSITYSDTNNLIESITIIEI